MSVTFAEPRYVVIQYRTFDRMGTDGRPCGCFSYYAKPEVALATGLYVEMMVLSTDNLHQERDFMGDLFTKNPWVKATPEQCQMYMSRCRDYWNEKTRSIRQAKS